jgi:hypothetical protein
MWKVVKPNDDEGEWTLSSTKGTKCIPLIVLYNDIDGEMKIYPHNYFSDPEKATKRLLRDLNQQYRNVDNKSEESYEEERGETAPNNTPTTIKSKFSSWSYGEKKE